MIYVKYTLILIIILYSNDISNVLIIILYSNDLHYVSSMINTKEIRNGQYYVLDSNGLSFCISIGKFVLQYFLQYEAHV